MFCQLGTHMCPTKPNIKKYQRLVREAMVRNSSAGACAIQQSEVGDALGEYDTSEGYATFLQQCKVYKSQPGP